MREHRPSPEKSRRSDADSRDRIILVFDDQYNLNGNVVFAATRHLTNQMQDRFDYRVFCRGKYKGPRFKRGSNVRVVGRKLALFAHGMRLRDRIVRKLAKYHILESEEQWISNVEQDERSLLQALFHADKCHAVVVFAHDPSYGLRIAKLSHIFSTGSIPHLLVVTPALQISRWVVEDLRRLGARVLRDGEPAARQDSKEPKDATIGDLSDNGVLGLAAIPNLGATLASFDYRLALSFLDKSVFPYQAGATNPAVVWEDWIGEDQSYRPRVRDVVLCIRPDWINCGSGTLFESVARWFLDNDGLMIDIALWPFRDPFDVKTRNLQIAMEQRHIRSALYFSLRRSTSLPYLLSRIVTLVRHPPRTIASQTLFQYTMAATPPLMTKALRGAKITHIYLFHYFTYAYARGMIGGRKFFLDTHDIQAINFAQNAVRNMITRRSDSFPAMFEDEMRVVRLAERVGFVSQAELELAATNIPREKLNLIIPIPHQNPCAPRPIGTPPRLLIVASGNRGNQRNVNWFLTEVWPIMLAQSPARPQGESGEPPFEIVICGSVADFLPPLEMPGIHLMGVVEDLREQYERCDLVLLPVITGAGVGIKTVEAVLYERPVVATFHALRGLPRNVVEAIGYVDDAAMFARQATLVVTSKSAHAHQTERSRRGAKALQEENFYRRLGQAMEAVRLDAKRAPEAVRESLPEQRFPSRVRHASGD